MKRKVRIGSYFQRVRSVETGNETYAEVHLGARSVSPAAFGAGGSTLRQSPVTAIYKRPLAGYCAMIGIKVKQGGIAS